MNVSNEIQKRESLYESMIIKSSVLPSLYTQVGFIKSNQPRYESISHHFPNPGLKWWLVAVLHSLECSLNFTRYLGNGQPLNQVTTISPKGRGPFDTFEAGAIDAIEENELDKIADWSIGNVLFKLEGYNGYGYIQHGINSPYLWAGSNQYVSGKFISDGHFDPRDISSQIGVALLLKNLILVQ